LPYDSDIWPTTSVSGVDDQTRDSCIAVYVAKKDDVIGLRKCLSFQYRKSPDHGDWWNIYGTYRSYLPYGSDIWRTASVSGVDVQSRDSSMAVYNGNKYDVIGLRKCVSFPDRKSPAHDDWWNV